MDNISLSQKSSQCNSILDYMFAHGSITPMEALEELGCFRLSSRIHDLRKSGWLIETNSVKRNGKRFARYILKGHVDV